MVDTRLLEGVVTVLVADVARLDFVEDSIEGVPIPPEGFADLIFPLRVRAPRPSGGASVVVEVVEVVVVVAAAVSNLLFSWM